MARIQRRPQAGADQKAARARAHAAAERAKPVLYIGIVGTLVLQEGSSYRVVPFSREFLGEIAPRFQIVFLTRLSLVAAREVASLLGIDASYGEWRKGLGKVSGIDFTQPFLWIDDTPSSRDLMRLAEERCSGRLITVNGKDGITRTTLNKVEACYAELLQPAG